MPTNARNILGTPLEPCCHHIRTGFFRDGYCNTNALDTGGHVVCAVMTEAFLDFTEAQGNDLKTPRPEFDFPGLQPGDTWCLCASRWLEAHHAGVAPPIRPTATHEQALDTLEGIELQPYYQKHELL